MIIKSQKPIEFINQCGCIYKTEDLLDAIKWYSKRPVARIKTIYLYGEYPAISIYEQKIHLHRLLVMWILKRELDTSEYVHHEDGNKLNALTTNLVIQSSEEHQRLTNKGRRQSPSHIAKRINATSLTRYGHTIYENPELLK